MNRRAFCGAFAALLAMPFAVVASWSVPRFVVDADRPCRFHFTPFGELDWIDMPSEITAICEVGDTLEISCVGGVYSLHHPDDPALMYIRRHAAKNNRSATD